MADQQKRKRLGEILIEMGFLNDEKLALGLDLQKREGGLLGEVLIRHNIVSEEEVVVALATQFNFPYLDPSCYTINNAAIKAVAVDVAVKYTLIPLDITSSMITLVMADPSNDRARDEIKRLTQLRVQAFVGSVSEVEEAIRKNYKIPDLTIKRMEILEQERGGQPAAPEQA